MKAKVLRLITACLLLVSANLIGCANTGMPNATEQKAAYHGPEPTTLQIQNAINKHIETTLKDPFSAMIKDISKPVEGHIRGALIDGYPLSYGWLLTFSVNAKNSYGGYTGYQKYTLLLRDGAVVQVM